MTEISNGNEISKDFNRTTPAGTYGSERGWVKLLGFIFHLLPVVKVMALSRSPPTKYLRTDPNCFNLFRSSEDLSC